MLIKSRIFDTMLMVSDKAIQSLPYSPQSNTLETIYNSLQYAVETQVILGIENEAYMEETCFHEAGYDSYITGYCFAKMLHFIPMYDLEKYRNKAYSHRSCFAYNFFGEDSTPDNAFFRQNQYSRYQFILED